MTQTSHKMPNHVTSHQNTSHQTHHHHDGLNPHTTRLTQTPHAHTTPQTKRPTIRDSLFILAHNEHLQPHIHPKMLATGLTGATLIDLILARRIHLHHHHILLTDHTPTTDLIANHTLHIIRPTQRPVPTLRHIIDHLTPMIYERTLGSLIAAAVIIPTPRRWRPPRLTLADNTLPARIRGGPRSAAQNNQTWDLTSDTLCALIRILKLHDTLYLGPASELDPALHQATTRLRHLTDTPLSGLAPIIDTIEEITADTVVAVYR